MHATSVIATEKSQNAKLSTNKTCSTTWVAQQSCPASCVFIPKDADGNIDLTKQSACYATQGPSGWITKRLNAAGETDTTRIAEHEAKAIRGLSGKFDLRLHVVGDCKTEAAASIVADACAEHVKKCGKRVWTYTHAWKDVRKSAWEEVSVLASCQTLEEVSESHTAGYAPALVVTEHKSTKAYDIGGGFKGVPCPQQTGRAKSCVDCGLCMNAEKLHARKSVILFALHGQNKSKATDFLEL